MCSKGKKEYIFFHPKLKSENLHVVPLGSLAWAQDTATT